MTKDNFPKGLSKCCTHLPHTHGRPGQRKSQPSFGTTSTSWTFKPEAWHLLIRSRVWIAAAPIFLLKRSLPPSPNILINFPIIGTTLSAASVAFFNCDSLACRKSESCLALHQSPNILNPFNDLTLIDIKPTYKRRSQPLVNCKEINDWVSFFFMWTLSFSTICVKFLRISDTSCYLKCLMWSLLVRKFCMLLLSTPVQNITIQPKAFNAAWVSCSAVLRTLTSPKAPSALPIASVCSADSSTRNSSLRERQRTFFTASCHRTQCYRDPGLNDWTESTYYIPSKSTQACHPPMISWMLPDRTGGVQQRFDFPHSWTKHSRSPTILTRAKPTNSKQDDLTIFPRPSELDSTLRWQAPMPHRDRSLMPAYALRPKAQS